MSTLKDLKHENTLSGLASAGTSCNYLIWAVIIDISEPTKSSNSSNFVTYLKIIDPSLNYRVKNNTCKDLRFHKYVTVYIYTETPEVAPKINYVGEIIRLRRFKFKVTDNGVVIPTATINDYGYLHETEIFDDFENEADAMSALIESDKIEPYEQSEFIILPVYKVNPVF